MKNKKSKNKRGFTLVEIIVAFAVFSIFALMIVQMLNLTIQRRGENDKLQGNIENQQEKLAAGTKVKTYNAGYDDGTLEVNFSGVTNPMEINYQLRDVDNTLGEKGGVNYFVGDVNYNYTTTGSETTQSGNASSNTPGSNNHGTQASRLDTRIEGTRGLKNITVTVANTHVAGTTKYTLTVSADSSSPDCLPDDKPVSQFTLYFGTKPTNTQAGKLVEVKSCKCTDNNVLVQRSGKNGVNINCKNNSDGFTGTDIVFDVELSEEIPELEFGSNIAGSSAFGSAQVYNKYTETNGGATIEYKQIYGAYPKAVTTANTP